MTTHVLQTLPSCKVCVYVNLGSGHQVHIVTEAIRVEYKICLTLGRHWESNPKLSDPEFNALSIWSRAPTHLVHLVCPFLLFIAITQIKQKYICNKRKIFLTKLKETLSNCHF